MIAWQIQSDETYIKTPAWAYTVIWMKHNQLVKCHTKLLEEAFISSYMKFITSNHDVHFACCQPVFLTM